MLMQHRKGENMEQMEEKEKKAVQARHRLEEAEARNRQRERKARTRRLIQLGAILESVFPEIKNLTLDDVKGTLERRRSGTAAPKD